MVKICTCPVQHRHEVVSDGLDAAFAQIADGLFVTVDIKFTGTGGIFDIFVNRETFHNAPGHTGLFDHLFAFEDGFFAPEDTVRDVVQRCNDSGGSRLRNEMQRHRIFRPIPAECGFHKHK